MSGTISIIQLAAQIGASALNNLFFGAQRSIDGIEPDISIQEVHSDKLYLTRHPVEQGTQITDHSYLEFPELEMRIGFSDAGLFNGPGYSRTMYQQLLALMSLRQFIIVSTGKRIYDNVIITAINTETTVDTEYSAILVVRMEQVTVATTSVTSVPAQANQSNPATTAATTNTGTTTPATPAASPSILSSIYHMFSPSAATGAAP